MALRTTAKHGTGFWCEEHDRFVLPLKLSGHGTKWEECPICFFEGGNVWKAPVVVNKPTEYVCSYQGCDQTRKTREAIENHEAYGHMNSVDWRENVLCKNPKCVRRTEVNFCQKCSGRYCNEHMEMIGSWGVCKPCATAHGVEDVVGIDGEY